MSVLLIHNAGDTAYNQNSFQLAANVTKIFYDRVEDIRLDTDGVLDNMTTANTYAHPFVSTNYGDVPRYGADGNNLIVIVADSISAINSNSTDIRSNNPHQHSI